MQPNVENINACGIRNHCTMIPGSLDLDVAGVAITAVIAWRR